MAEFQAIDKCSRSLRLNKRPSQRSDGANKKKFCSHFWHMGNSVTPIRAGVVQGWWNESHGRFPSKEEVADASGYKVMPDQCVWPLKDAKIDVLGCCGKARNACPKDYPSDGIFSAVALGLSRLVDQIDKSKLRAGNALIHMAAVSRDVVHYEFWGFCISPSLNPKFQNFVEWKLVAGELRAAPYKLELAEGRSRLNPDYTTMSHWTSDELSKTIANQAGQAESVTCEELLYEEINGMGTDVVMVMGAAGAAIDCLASGNVAFIIYNEMIK